VLSSSALYVLQQNGGDGRAQIRTDLSECRVDPGCQRAHAGGRTESDQSDNESVLDQVLTIFAVLQVLKLHVDLQKQVLHCYPLRVFDLPDTSQEVEDYPLVPSKMIKTIQELTCYKKAAETYSAWDRTEKTDIRRNPVTEPRNSPLRAEEQRIMGLKQRSPAKARTGLW